MSRLKQFWPLVLIAFLVTIFFWQFFLRGLVPFPADFVVGVYFPWLDYDWGFPTGVPVKNPLLADVPSFIYPLKSYLADLLKQGKLPLWNPLQFGGYPLLANFQSGTLNPTNLLYLFFSKPIAWAGQVILQPFLIATFTYLFLRNLKLKKMASLLGAVIFAFSGFSLIWLEYVAHGYVVALIPLLLFLIDKWLKEKKLTWGVFFSLALALQIFAGYPQVTLYTLVLVLFYFWMRLDFKLFSRKAVKTHMALGSWLFLGLALSAIQLVPGWELLSLSQRVEESVSGGLAVAFLPWKQLISLIAPDFFGNPATYNYWGPGNYTNGAGYSSLVGLILATIAIFGLKKRKEIPFFAGLFGISLLLALPTPFAKFIASSGFLGLKAAAATRILCLTNFSVAVLAALAIEFLSQQRKKGPILKVCLFFILFILILMLGLFVSRQLTLTDSWVASSRVSLRNLILPLLLATAALCLLWLTKKRIFNKLALWGLFILVVFELFRFGWKFTPFSEPRIIFPTTPVLEFLQKQEKPVRISTGDAIPISMWMPYGLESASGYDALYPQRWATLINVINGGKVTRQMGRYGAIEKYDSRLFDLTNTCYVLAVKHVEKDGRFVPDKTGEPGSLFQLEKFEKVFDEGAVAVLANKECFPRAFFAHRYRVETDIKKTIELLENPDFDLRKEIVLEEKPPFNSEEDSDKITVEEKLVWRQYEPGRIAIQLTNDRPGLLFLADSDYPGWQALVDGQETIIYRADFAFRAVFVPEGEHEVRFIYDPQSFKIGALISLISLFFAGGILIYEKKSLKKKNRR